MNFLSVSIFLVISSATLADERLHTNDSSSTKNSKFQINDVISLIANISLVLNPSIVDFCSEDFTETKEVLKNYHQNHISIAGCQKEAIFPSETLNLKIYQKAQKLRSECLFCHIKVLHVNDSDVGKSRNLANREYWNSQGTYFYVLLMSKFTRQELLIGPPRTTYWIEAIYNKNYRSFKIYEVYSLSSSPEPLLQSAAQWSLDRGFILEKNWPMGFGPRNFQGKAIRTATLDYTAPYISKAPLCSEHPEINHCIKDRPKYQIRPENTTGYYEGFIVKLFDDMAEQHNFTYIVDSYGIEYFGLRTPDGYDGLESLIWNRKVDMLIHSIFMSDLRFTYMEFSHLIESTYKAMFYNYKAVKFAGRWGIYTDSFSSDIWLAIFSSLIIYSLYHWILRKYEAHNKMMNTVLKLNNFDEEPLPENYAQISDIFMTYFSCTVQQGLSDTPSATYIRILFWVFWITSVVLYASYSGILTSFLTLDSQIPEFGTLKEAIEAKEWDVGLLKGSLGHTQLSYSKKSWHIQLTKDLALNPDLLSGDYAEAYRRTQTSKYVYYDDVVNMAYLYTNCTLRKIPDKDFRVYGYFAKHKYLPYSRLFDHTILKTFTGGIQDRHAIRYLHDQQICEKPSGYNEMEIYHIFPACIVFSLGLGISVCFLILERAVYAKVSTLDRTFYSNEALSLKLRQKMS